MCFQPIGRFCPFTKLRFVLYAVFILPEPKAGPTLHKNPLPWGPHSGVSRGSAPLDAERLLVGVPPTPLCPLWTASGVCHDQPAAGRPMGTRLLLAHLPRSPALGSDIDPPGTNPSKGSSWVLAELPGTREQACPPHTGGPERARRGVMAASDDRAMTKR